MATLRVYLFGGLHLLLGEAPLPPFPTRKTRSLFAYLATFHQHAHRRDVLAGVLWSGMPDSQARRNLNTALWRLRRTVPDDYLHIRSDSVALVPTEDCWIDIAAFERLLGEAGLDTEAAAATTRLPEPKLGLLLQATGLYRGELLEGLDETWSLVEAERLRSLYLRALQRLVGHYRAADDAEQALAYVQLLLAVDPLREELHRQAMELYVALGRSDQAIDQFEQCRRLLEEELGISPLIETVALYGRIRAGGGPTRPAEPLPEPPHPAPLPRTPFDDLGQVPLVGREEEMATLADRLAAAARGQGGMVLIEGEAGVGKTRLAHSLCRQAANRGWLVLRGGCPALGEAPPYYAWIEALRTALDPGRAALARIPSPWLAEASSLLPEIKRLFPDLPAPADLPPRQRQEKLQQALEHILVGLAQGGPLLLLLEDLQWADGATLGALDAVVPRLRDRPILVLGTARAEEIGPRLRECRRRLEEAGCWQGLFLPRLSQEQTGRLAGAVLGWPVPAPLFVQRLYRETEGNPLFVLEVLKGLFEEGLLARGRGGQWSLAGEAGLERDWPLPRGIRQVVLRRLERLADRSRQLLGLAAVAGSSFDAEILQQVSGWKEEDFLEASDELLRRQLLVESDLRLHFVHEQVRRIIYRQIDPTQRRELHRRVGQALERRAPERVEELAYHFYRGQMPERALPYCMQAGERAFAVYASSAALAYLGQAISAARRLKRAADRPAVLRAHERRAQVLEYMGEYEQAGSEYAAMLAVAREAGDASAVARAIRRDGWLRGYSQEQWELGLRAARRAYEVAAAAGDAAEKAAALRDIGAYESMRGDYDAAIRSHRAALDFARQAGDAGEEATILQYIAVAHLFLSQDDRALEVFRQALAIRERLHDLRIAAKIRSNIGLLQINRGEFAEAERSLRQAEAEFRETGALPALPMTWIGLATVLRYRGEPAAGLPLLEAAAQVQATVGGSAYMDALIHLHRGSARWDLGQLQGGLGDVRTSVELARASNTPTLLVGCLRVLGHCLRELGAPGPASVCHSEAIEAAERVSFRRGQVENLVGLGLDELAEGHVPDARQRLVEALALARPLGPQMRAEAAAALAGLCLEEWRLGAARALAGLALALAEQMGLRLLQAQALLLLGQALARMERFPEAETALRRALALCDPPGYPGLRWEVLLHLAHLLAEVGRPAEADRFAEQARAVVREALAGLEEDLGQAFRRRPAARALLGETGEPPAPGQARFVLARRGAPTGRPLRAAEQVDVIWTLPSPVHGPEKVPARRANLLRLLNEARAQGGDPNEGDLARALGVTVRTVRSDIAALRAAGRPVRTRGTRAP